jgi:dienelactone hydrolase
VKNYRYNLSLLKVANGVFLKADNNGYSILFDVKKLGNRRRVVRIDEDAIWHIPVSKAHGNIRFVLTTRGQFQYRQNNEIIDIPDHFVDSYGMPYYYDYSTNIVLTLKNGIAYILRMDRGFNRTPIRIRVVAGGNITPDLYSRFTDRNSKPLNVLIEDPCKGPYSLFIDNHEEIVHIRSSYRGADNNHFNRVCVRSADGTDVYAGYVVRRAPGEPKRNPRGLLVVIYGAYGMPTIIGSIMRKWGPLLESGWAIGFAYVRGGGDNGWDWAEAGRRDQRYKSLEDAEACIAGLRRRLRLPAAHTIIYGRSAGGIQVGALANRNPQGDLFRGIYCEVPYLDVLQTTTNPSLPLTELEYDEFGDPRHRLADLSFWVRHSPVTNVPAAGLPALMILCRTGLNDTQVYAYEPLKWILKARGSSPAPSMPKLLGIEADQGHFYIGDTEINARTIDLAVLDAFIGYSGTQE